MDRRHEDVFVVGKTFVVRSFEASVERMNSDLEAFVALKAKTSP